MKITKKLLRNRHKAALKADAKKKVKSFRSWVNDTGQDIVSYYKNKSVEELDFSDEALKLLEKFI